jgi:hypothetical protein
MISVNNEFERIRNEKVVAEFKSLSQNLPGDMENDESLSSHLRTKI